MGPHPLEEVEDQCIDSVGHGGHCGLEQVGQYIASLSSLTKASCYKAIRLARLLQSANCK